VSGGLAQAAARQRFATLNTRRDTSPVGSRFTRGQTSYRLGRSSDSRIVLTSHLPMFLPSSGADLIVSGSVGGRLSTSNTVAAARHEQLATLVPGYSGGTATDSHRLPYSLEGNTPSSTQYGSHATKLRMGVNPRGDSPREHLPGRAADPQISQIDADFHTLAE
jgi:hypothetical protein